MNKTISRFILSTGLVAASMFVAPTVFAQCAAPVSIEGGINYDAAADTLNVCDGTNWLVVGPGGISADSIDWDDITDAMTLDATTTIDMTAGDLNFDSNTFFIDSSANAIGIGTAPGTKLHIEDSTDGLIETRMHATSTGTSVYTQFQARNNANEGMYMGLTGGNYTGGALGMDNSDGYITTTGDTLRIIAAHTNAPTIFMGGSNSTPSETMRITYDARVGIGTAANPNANAALEVTGTNLGFLPPRNTDPGTNITGTAGLIAYDSTDNELQFYNGSAWVAVATGSSIQDRIQDSNNNTYIDVDSSDDGTTDRINFFAASSNKMLMDANGIAVTSVESFLPTAPFMLTGGATYGTFSAMSDFDIVVGCHGTGSPSTCTQTNRTAGFTGARNVNDWYLEYRADAHRFYRQDNNLLFGIDPGTVVESNIFTMNGDLAISNEVYINAGTQQASAILQVDSSTQGFLPPRNTDPNTNISLPATGLIAYDSTDNELQFYNGTAWVAVATSGVSAIDDLSDAIYDGSSLYIGANSGSNDDGTANRNLGVGRYALQANTSGNDSVALGYGALGSQTVGTSNVGVGYNVLSANTSGTRNTALGNQAMLNATGSNNMALGAQALRDNTGNNNIAVGAESLFNTTGDFNTAVGNSAMNSNTSGDSNVAIGHGAMMNNVDGTDNVVIGYGSGDTLTTGSTNILIGHNAEPSGTTVSNELNIGGTIFGNLSTNRIGIGVTSAATINANAALEVTGTNLGFLPPRNTDPGTNITGTAGLIAYDSTDNELQFYNGTAWVAVATGAGVTPDSLDWSDFTDTMTLDATTTIDMDTNTADLNFDGNTFVIDSSANNVGIGTATPTTDLHVYDGAASAVGAIAIEGDEASISGLALHTTGDGATLLGSGVGSTGWLWEAKGSTWATADEQRDLFLSYWNGTTWDEWMFVSYDTGNIGLGGNIDPAVTLDVTGTIKMGDGGESCDANREGGMKYDAAGDTFYFCSTAASGWEAISLGSGVSAINDLSDATTRTTSVSLGSGAGANEEVANNRNTAVGIDALNTNVTANNNTAVGYSAMSNSTGQSNTAFGATALQNATNSNNVAVGSNTLNATTSGQRNTAVGTGAGSANDTGSNNTLIGFQTGDVLTTGNSNIIIGYDVDPSSATASNEMNIGGTIFGNLSTGQIGIGVTDATAINANAALEVTGTDLGFLPPRNADPATNITGTAGLIAYDSTDNELQFYNGSSWVAVATGGGASAINDLSDATTDYVTDFNLFMGDNAGASIASGGRNNLGIGQNAGDAITTGDSNVAVGYNTLTSVVDGYDNVAVGKDAAQDLATNSYQNVLIGASAGQSMSQGYHNIGIGYGAGYQGLGFGSVAIGNGAIGSYSAAWGTNQVNVGIGLQALSILTDGTGNVALGGGAGGDFGASARNGEMNHNTLIGYEAGNSLDASITSPEYNTFLGSQAGSNVTTGDSNILIGYGVSASSATVSNELNIGGLIHGDIGSSEVFLDAPAAAPADGDLANGQVTFWVDATNDEIELKARDSAGDIINATVGGGGGSVALNDITDVWHDTTTDFSNGNLDWVGDTDDDDNLFIGHTASTLQGTASGSQGAANIAIGATAMDSITQGDMNIAIGIDALTSITDDSSNVAIGAFAGTNISNTSTDSVLIGAEVARNADRSFWNVAIGKHAGYNGIGFGSVAIGGQAMSNLTQAWQTSQTNIAIGLNTLRFMDAGGGNVAIGVHSAGDFNTTGRTGTMEDNTLIGERTGFSFDASSDTVINNTLIGASAGDAITTGGSNILLGAFTDTSSATASNEMNLGNTIYSNMSIGNVGIGVSNASSIDSSALFQLDSTARGFLPPRMTTTQRNAINGGFFATGLTVYNTTDSELQVYDGSSWVSLGGGGGGASALDGLSDATTDYATDINLFIGEDAGAAIASGGRHNTLIGIDAGDSLTTGDENVVIGRDAGQAMTVQGYSTIIGHGAAVHWAGSSEFNSLIAIGNTAAGQQVDGFENIAIGNTAMNAGGGSRNTLLGGNAGYGGLGDENTLVGHNVMADATAGSYNVVMGQNAANGQAGADISQNVIIGHDAANGINTGANDNVIIGFNAGNGVTTGAANIIIGSNADTTASTASNELNIGNLIYGDLFNDYVGIGNSDPDVKLHVGPSSLSSEGGTHEVVISDTTGQPNILFIDGGNDETSIGITNDDYFAIATEDTQSGIQFKVNADYTTDMLNTGTVAMTIQTDGDVGIGVTNPTVALDISGDIEYTGTITDVSDRRLKDNIKPLSRHGSLIEKINTIDTYSFSMKDDEDGKTEFGVIAQELEEIFPELVRTSDDEMGTKSVNYVGLIAPIIEATKELKSENDALKAEISEIKQNIAGMKMHTGYGFEKANIQNLAMMFIMMLFGGTCVIAMNRFQRKS